VSMDKFLILIECEISVKRYEAEKSL